MTDDESVISPFRHQRQFCTSPFIYRDIEDFFLIGGYGCGKSFSIVLLILNIVDEYDGHEISVGLGSVTISLFRKTIWVDLERILKMSGSEYSYDKQQNTIRIGTIIFQIIPTENPGDIYAYNFSIFICDEIDELPQDKSVSAFTAIHERTRVILPDGRIPFACFATTAQGYKGCYQITQDLSKSQSDHIVIKGHTKDNTSLSPKYVKKLYSLYNENERKAYLEGEFINLSTGRVYGDYDQSTNMIPRFEVSPEETVFVGQDLNIGFSRGVAFIKRNKNLYVVRTFNFKSLASAPSELRKAFPLNRIEWHPDANAEEIMTAYSREIKDHGIILKLSNQNPSIIERTFIANKMFKIGRLFLMDTKDENGGSNEDLDMALKVRQFDETGKPSKGRGEKAPDHVCDGFEYALFRIVCSDIDYIDIYDIAKKLNQAQKIRINTGIAA